MSDALEAARHLLAAIRDLIEGDAYELGSASWWDEYHEIMFAAPPVAVTEPPIEDDDVWGELGAWEPSNVMLQPVYCGEIGARGVIDTWRADIALPRGHRSLYGSGRTIPDAIRAALGAAQEGE